MCRVPCHCIYFRIFQSNSWCFSFRNSSQMCVFFIVSRLHMPHVIIDNIWWTVHIMKLFILQFSPTCSHSPFTSDIIRVRIYPQSVFFLKRTDTYDCSKYIFTTKLNSSVSFRVIYDWRGMTKAQAYLRYFGIMTTESQNYQLSICKTIRGVSAVGCSLSMALRKESDLSLWPSVSST